MAEDNPLSMKEADGIKKKVTIVSIAFVVLICIATVALLFYNGVIRLNNPSTEKFPVRGIDVSVYQGKIDWAVLASENIQFAFIKATEGSSFVDPTFRKNYLGAIKTKLRIGAYHFFSYDSSGKTQAKNFISAVPKTKNMLPPVVDIEFYGDKEKVLPDKKSTQTELSVLIKQLKDYYGLKPIIYATEKSYKLYIANDYAEYDIWIRNVMTQPSLCDKKKWTFWQYSYKGILKGYKGKEKFVDMNVFCGTKEEFDSYGK